MKLLCSLPDIEQTLLSLLQTLTFHVSESRDREARLHQRMDDLSAHLLGLREEFCSLQKSAIVPDKAPARSQHQAQGDKSRTRTKPPQLDPAANQLKPSSHSTQRRRYGT